MDINLSVDDGGEVEIEEEVIFRTTVGGNITVESGAGGEIISKKGVKWDAGTDIDLASGGGVDRILVGGTVLIEEGNDFDAGRDIKISSGEKTEMKGGTPETDLDAGGDFLVESDGECKNEAATGDWTAGVSGVACGDVIVIIP